MVETCNIFLKIYNIIVQKQRLSIFEIFLIKNVFDEKAGFLPEKQPNSDILISCSVRAHHRATLKAASHFAIFQSATGHDSPVASQGIVGLPHILRFVTTNFAFLLILPALVAL